MKKSKSKTIQSKTIEDLQDCRRRFRELLMEEKMRYNNLQRQYETCQQKMEDLDRDWDGVYGENDDEAVYNEKELEIIRRKRKLVTTMSGCLEVIESLQNCYDDAVMKYEDMVDTLNFRYIVET